MSETLPAAPKPALSTAQQHHVLNIVRRAAKAEILPRFRALSQADVKSKSRPDDLVTAADTAAEAMMTRALQTTFPHALIIGEEAVAENAALLGKIADAPLAFIIDPIDGTWNFAHELAVFGVIVAVTQFGRPVFGLIYDPVADDWAIADTDAPARFERAQGPARELKASQPKPVEELAGYIPLNLFAHHQRPKVAAALPSFARSHTLRCSAHEYRMIAQGHTDFLLTATLLPWDHAAGAVICRQAGAHVEMLEGGDYTAGRHEGHLLVAPDKETWTRLRNIFSFLLD